MKYLICSLLIVMSSAYSQAKDCPAVAMTRSSILKSALEQLHKTAWDMGRFDLTEVVVISVDDKRAVPRVIFQTNSSENSEYMNYETCGSEIEFSEIMN